MRNRRLSPEHKRRIALAHIGKKRPPFNQEWLDNLSKAHKGRNFSPETREKIRQRMIGKQLCLGRTGPLAGNWRGGTSTINERIRNSAAYIKWRQHVFDRDDYTCQACGKRGGKLHADHELPFASYPHLRLEILNGRTLCVPCHKKTPSYGSSKKVDEQPMLHAQSAPHSSSPS